MDEQITPEDKRQIQNNNILLVCGMLTFYGFCLLASFGAIVWALEYEKQAYVVNVTSTAFAVETQQADAAATVIVRATEQSQYEFIEHFDEVSARWYVGSSDSDFGNVRYSIRDGSYIWDVRQSKGPTFSIKFYKGRQISDFDVYMDMRFVESESQGQVCAGLAFLKMEDNWDAGAFVFIICNDAHFEVYFYDEADWSPVTTGKLENIIQPEDWNRIQINARSGHFLFTINSVNVFEMTEDRLEQGNLRIYFQVPSDESAEVWFDNFGFQSR